MQINSEGEEYKTLLERENQTLKDHSDREIDRLRKSLEQSEAKLKQLLQKELLMESDKLRQ